MTAVLVYTTKQLIGELTAKFVYGETSVQQIFLIDKFSDGKISLLQKLYTLEFLNDEKISANGHVSEIILTVRKIPNYSCLNHTFQYYLFKLHILPMSDHASL